MTEEVRLLCEVNKVQNVRAGGFRITLDAPSTEVAQSAMLMCYADQPGCLWEVTFKRVEEDGAQKQANARETRDDLPIDRRW